ncbi:hypothetical protein HPP92_013249 [Vanilla planifolia]|uniref:Fanconi anemia group I protein n=1 Tax=Vanilla planifolia TaxID=51239 RepID=A0A835QYP1_VANPL|nr:hypothetical protein HPP92_013249 [Vanilla planifolia]
MGLAKSAIFLFDKLSQSTQDIQTGAYWTVKQKLAAEVVQQCKFCILSTKHHQSSPVIKLLGHLVKYYPYPMLEYVSHLKELLDYFTFLYGKTAVAVIDAMLPLIKFSKDLQDYIILVVRKAMFSREDNVRIAATSVIIDLILEENKLTRSDSLQESSSQASSSQQAGLICRTKGRLFHELSGFLRRCLTQQVSIREVVYKGLLKLVMLDPAIAVHVFDFLWPHFLLFYNKDAEYPLWIDVCYKMDNGKQSHIEPLDCLLSCMSWIYLLQQHGRSDHQSESSLPCFGFSLSPENEAFRASSSELFVNAFVTVRKTLSRWIFEGCLKQSGDLGSHSFLGEKSCYSGLLLGILEVFINVATTEMEKAALEDMVFLEKEVMCLVDSYDFVEKESGLIKGSAHANFQNISDYDLKDSPHASQLKSFPITRSFFATSSICKLLTLAVNSYSSINLAASQGNSESSMCKTLDECLKLISFVLKVCLRHLRSIMLGCGVLNDGPFETIVYGDFKQIGLPLMQLVSLLKSGSKLDHGKKKKVAEGKKFFRKSGDLLLLSLLCLNDLFRISTSKACLLELVEMLDTMGAEELDLGNAADTSEGRNNVQPAIVDNPDANRLHAFLINRINPLYSGLITRSLFQEAEALHELFLIIWRTLTFEQREQYGTWMLSVFKDRKITSPKFARSVVTIVLYLTPASNDLITARHIALELIQVMGSQEKEAIKISVAYPFLNYSTKSAVAAALMQFIETCLVELDWSVSKLKAEFNIKHDFNIFIMDNRFVERPPGMLGEEMVHSRSEALVLVLSAIAEMNLEDSLAEQFLKLTAKFYKLLSRMAKLQIAPKGCKQLLPGQKFQKLAEVTCRRLTCALYNFVTSVQWNQQANARGKGMLNRIKRENRCIPDLIFQIEDYERYLIQLSKLTNVNLLRNAKRSTTRDFRILEVEKAAEPEEINREPSPEANLSENESGERSGGTCERHVSVNASSPETIGEDGGPVDSESDENEVDVIIRNKKAKTRMFVHDSEEEA